jgi:hypothetical protein
MSIVSEFNKDNLHANLMYSNSNKVLIGIDLQNYKKFQGR